MKDRRRRGGISQRRYKNAIKNTLAQFLAADPVDQNAMRYECWMNVLMKALQVRVEDLIMKKFVAKRKVRELPVSAATFFRSKPFYWMCTCLDLPPMRIKNRLYDQCHIKDIFTKKEASHGKAN